MPIACATQSCWMMHCHSLNEPLSVLPKAWTLHKFLKPSISLPCTTDAAVVSPLKLFGASFFAFVFLSSSFCNNMVQPIVRLEQKSPEWRPWSGQGTEQCLLNSCCVTDIYLLWTAFSLLTSLSFLQGEGGFAAVDACLICFTKMS